MKHQNLFGLLLAAAMVTQACNSADKNGGTTDSTMEDHAMADHTLTDTAKTPATSAENGVEGAMFVENAATGGMLEVEMGKIGQQKGNMKEVKDLGAMIEKDHLKANAQLKVLAQQKGFKLPSALPPAKQEHIKSLNTMTGKNFDRYYVNMIVENHITDIALFEGATKSPDTAISNFAVKTLPVLQNHYKKARELSAGFDPNDLSKK